MSMLQVPDGYKMVVSAVPGGAIRRVLHPLVGRRSSWQWSYYANREGVTQIEMQDLSQSRSFVQKMKSPVMSENEFPFTYII